MMDAVVKVMMSMRIKGRISFMLIIYCAGFRRPPM